MPTLIVWGEQDRLIPPAHARAWERLIAGSRVLMVPEAGHLVPDEKPEAVDEIARFLSVERASACDGAGALKRRLKPAPRIS
jgi:pimeloyl-ACP methyl ester carboxylesterase